METKQMHQVSSQAADSSCVTNAIDQCKNLSQDPNMSHRVNELVTALAKAQSEFKVAELNKKNPFFKSNYADFQSIVAASRHYLAKNGLAVVQQIENSDHEHTSCDQLLATKLLHSSGQWIQSIARITPQKTDVQAFSSYITYLKRISYSALVGVVTGDEDDDGEAAVAPTRNNYYSVSKQEYITPEQFEQLEDELMDQVEITKMVMNGLNIKSLKDMPKNKFISSINRIREIKNNK